MDENVLMVNGLSVDLLAELSYRSQLKMSLKRTLRHFDKSALIDELMIMRLHSDHRYLMWQICQKEKRSMTVIGAFICIFGLIMRIAQFEIQYNTLYDRQLNNRLHDYVYKRS